MTATRSRWAAIGAATAIALGAGGLGIVNAGSSNGHVSNLKNIEPCRLEDSRSNPPGLRTTPLGPAASVTFAVHGTNGNCTIPTDATAVVANVTAFSATTNTYITAFSADTTVPLAALTNVGPGLILSNEVTIDLSAAGAIKVYNHAGTVDIAIDITAYYTDDNLDDRYYTKAEVDALIAAAAAPVVQGWYADRDGDGFGDLRYAVVSTTQPTDPPYRFPNFPGNPPPPASQWVTDFGDCNDSDPGWNPSAAEILGNLFDENCNSDFNS